MLSLHRRCFLCIGGAFSASAVLSLHRRCFLYIGGAFSTSLHGSATGFQGIIPGFGTERHSSDERKASSVQDRLDTAGFCRYIHLRLDQSDINNISLCSATMLWRCHIHHRALGFVCLLPYLIYKYCARAFFSAMSCSTATSDVRLQKPVV